MTHSSSNTASRKLHSRALLLVSLVVCLLSLNVWAGDPRQDTAEVTVNVSKYVSVEFREDNQAMASLDAINLGTVTWDANGMPVGDPDMTGSARLLVKTNTAATLAIPNTVALYLNGTVPGPKEPNVKISVNTSVPNGSILYQYGTTNPKLYTVMAPTTGAPYPGAERTVTLTVGMDLSSWSLENPAGTYRGILTVTITAN